MYGLSRKTIPIVISLLLLLPGPGQAEELSGPREQEAGAILPLDDFGYPRLFFGIYDNYYPALQPLIWIHEEQAPPFPSPDIRNPIEASAVSI